MVERAKYELISNKANTEHPGDNMQEVSLNQPTKSKIQAQVTYEGKVVLTVWYSIVEDISAGQNITLTDLYFKQKSHSILVGNEEEFTDNYVYLFLENYLVIKPDNALNYRLVYTLEENSELGTINPEGMSKEQVKVLVML